MVDAELSMSPLFELHAVLQRDTEAIGVAPEGLRTNLFVDASELSGPRLRGALRRSGGDWFVLRRNGVGIVDVRCTLETDDGALIFARAPRPVGARQGRLRNRAARRASALGARRSDCPLSYRRFTI